MVSMYPSFYPSISLSFCLSISPPFCSILVSVVIVVVRFDFPCLHFAVGQ